MSISDKDAARLRARLDAAIRAFRLTSGLPIAVQGMTMWPEPDGDFCVQIRLRVEEEEKTADA